MGNGRVIGRNDDERYHDTPHDLITGKEMLTSSGIQLDSKHPFFYIQLILKDFLFFGQSIIM
jgi:hypothetical protein